MRLILYILFIPLLFGACNNTTSSPVPDSIEEDGKEIELSFSIYMPDREVVQTRTASDVKELYLMVFDENKRFLSLNKAIVGGVTNVNGVQVRQFSVVLLSSSRPRFIHFIANYPSWEGFPPSHELRDKDEGYIVSRMESEQTIFWHRASFVNIKNSDAFNGKVFPLLRNRAKITLENRVQSKLNITGFAIYNALNRGTVAPFSYNNNTQEYDFTEGVLTPSLTAENAPNDMLPYPSINHVELFEKKNDAVNNELFIILQGNYLLNGANKTCYYKVVLVKDPTKGTLYDIVRNINYNVVITDVTSAGYATKEEAIANPPANNIFASTELKDYPSISNGKAILKIEKLGEVFVHSSEVFTTLIEYFPNKNNSAKKPEAIEVIRKEDNDDGYFNFNYNSNSGILRVNVLKVPNEEVKTYNLIVKTKESENNNLLRYITLVFRSPYDFNGRVTSAGSSQGGSVTISFDLPATIPFSVFPFQVKIRSKELSPDASQPDINIDFDGSEYFFTYNVQEELRGKKIDLKFKRVWDSNNSRKTVRLESKYFEDQSITFY